MMPHAEPVLRNFAALLTELFFTGMWQGTAMVLAISVMLRVFSRVGAEARYGVLRVAFVLLTVLPWVHFSHRALPRSMDGAALQVMPVLAMAIAAVWVVLAMVRAVQLSVAYRHLRAVWRRAVPLQRDGPTLQALSFGRRRVELCTSADVDSPTVLGFRRPRFLLPEWLAPTLTDADLQQIALHECEHLRRRDEWMNLLQQVALLMLPLHPALFWLNRRLNVQRELACDAGVIARTAEPIAYANCLTRLAEQRLQHRNRLRLALAAWERRSELAKRVHALLSHAATCTPAQSRFAAVAMTLVFAAGAAVMARAPQLVQVRDTIAPPAVLTATGPSTGSDRDRPANAFMQPVMYRVPEAGVMTASVRGHARRSATPMKKTLAVSPLRAVRRGRTAMRPGLLLTASPYRTPAPVANRPTRLVTTDFTHAYAAVPFGDGWLLIQL